MSYSYDSANISYGTGRLAKVTSGISTTTILSYDAEGRALASQQSTAGKTYNLFYGYDLSGELTSETYPSGRQISTQFDGAGREKKIDATLGGQPSTYVGSVSYAPHGGVGLMQMGNNVWRSFSYNSRLQTSEITDAINNDLSQTLVDQTFDWGTTNNNGNLNAVVTKHGGPGYAQFLKFKDYYWYDVLNRVSAANGKDANENLLWAQNFGYDRYGNRWVTGTGGLPISGLTPQTNVFTSANQIGGAAYDGAGNRVQLGADTLAYDAENRMVQATEAPAVGGGQETLVYDGDGRRVMKQIANGPTTVYVYDLFGALVAEYASQASGAAPPCHTCFLSTDHLGNTRLVTDENHAVAARHDYTPFGEEIPTGYAGRGSEWGAQDFVNQKFTGKERDQETGLDYFGARYYGSALGRFTSPDEPFADQDSVNPQSWNLYGYVRNNPLRFTDPDGRACKDGKDEAGNFCFAVDSKRESQAVDPGQVGLGLAKGLVNDFIGLANLVDAARQKLYGGPDLRQAGLEPSNQSQNRGIIIGTAATFLLGGGEGRVIRILEESAGTIHLEVRTSRGVYEVMGSNMRREGGKLILDRVHIEGTGSEQFGPSMIREIREAARQFGREQGATEVVINPGVRLGGANPGHIMPSFRVEVR